MIEDSNFQADVSADAAAQDILWMARIKEGDMEALQALIEAHQHRVIGAATRMMGDDADAEDIAQQVFIRVWKSAPRYEPTAKFTTWLFKIMRNLVFNELRRRKRHPTRPLEGTLEEGDRPMQTADVSAKSPDTVLLEEEMQVAVQRAIDGLPEVQRMAIVLRRFDEFSYEEIGDILELSVPAVKSVLFRARTELRERLKRYLEG
jgi:RNA polymerase sigma-70 factor (ECF subfamily)